MTLSDRIHDYLYDGSATRTQIAQELKLKSGLELDNALDELLGLGHIGVKRSNTSGSPGHTAEVFHILRTKAGVT
jgi:hypothetical protein